MSKKSLDPRIDTYIDEAATFARPILKHLRHLVHEGCPDVAETVKWSCPFFESSGRILCNMAAFKAHCVFGFWHQGMQEVLGGVGAKRDEAMGSFGRISSLDDLPADKSMLRFIKEAVRLNASDAPARPKSNTAQAAQELSVPDDLAAILKKHAKAAKTFTAFSRSKRKEYIDWLIDAKRPETRQSRLATTIEWLAEGKSRNWKYENC